MGLLKDDSQGKDDSEHGDEDISHVEDGEVKQLHLEHIHHITVNDPVDAVGEAAGSHHYQAPPCHAAGDKVGGKSQDHGNAEHHGNDDKVDAGPTAAEQTESGAVIGDIDKADHARDELDNVIAHEGVGDPVLHCLVQDDDQQSNNGIKHTFLLSICRRGSAGIFGRRQGEAASPVRGGG